MSDNNNNNNNTIITKEKLALEAYNLIKKNLFTASEYYLNKIKDLCNNWATEKIENLNNYQSKNVVKYKIIQFSINVVKVVTNGQQKKLDNLIELEEGLREQLEASLALKKFLKENFPNQLKSQMKY
tara:strand:+ start:46 stop:426 length:381 start_codon:yes stop_codon:yes gene_type:complete